MKNQRLEQRAFSLADEAGNLERRHQSKEVGGGLTLALIHPGCLRYYGRMYTEFSDVFSHQGASCRIVVLPLVVGT